MKTALSFLLICGLLFVDACRPQEPEKTTPSIISKSFYKAIVVKNSDLNLGYILGDTLKQEVALAYGQKNNSGYLTSLSSIIYYSPQIGPILNIEVGKDNLISEIGILSKNGYKSLVYDGYDLDAGTVNVQLIDRRTNSTIVSKRQLKLDTKALALLKQLKTVDINKGGRVNELCLTGGNIISLTLSYAGCAMSISLAVLEISSGIGSIFLSVTLPSLLLSCAQAVNNFNDFFDGKCNETTPKEVLTTVVACGLDAAKVFFTKDYSEAIGCVSNIIQNALGLETPPSSTTNPTSSTPTSSTMNPVNNKSPNGFSTGDPHLITTDGYYYDFQGFGEFIAVKSTTDNFEVQVRQEDVKNTGRATLNTAVAIQTGSDVVCLTTSPDNLYINGVIQLLNFDKLPLRDNAYIVRQIEATNSLYTTLYIINKNEDIVAVRYHGAYLLDYSLYLNKNRAGTISGLMGNFDGNPDNDLQIRNGKLIANSFSQLYPTYADSWRIQQSQSLFYYPPGKNTSSYTKTNFPTVTSSSTLISLAEAENICRKAGVTTDPHLSNCIYDVSITNDADLAQSSLWGQKIEASSNREFTINDFSAPSVPIKLGKDAQVVGKTLLFSYPATTNTIARVMTSKFYDISNGFETTYEFLMEKGNGLGINPFYYDYSYNILEAEGYNGFYNSLNRVGLYLSSTSSVQAINKSIPSLIDGKRHKAKIVLKNLTTSGLMLQMYIDDMENPVYQVSSTTYSSVYNYFTTYRKQPNALRALSIESWITAPNGSEGKITVYNWSFKSL